MKDSKQIYMGKSGTLTIGSNGVTIERNFAQASQQRTQREVHLNFNDIESMRHRYAADKPGYIEIKSKANTEGVGLNHRHKIHFDAATAHRFRRAQKQISRKLTEMQTMEPGVPTTVVSQQETTPTPQPTSQYRPAPIHVNYPTSPEPQVATRPNASAPLPPPTLTDADEPVDTSLPYRGMLGK